METNKLYIFYIKGWSEPLYGIIVDLSNEWVLIKRIVNDFFWDGYTLIRRKYIKRSFQNEDIIFKEKVLKSKGYMDNNVVLNFHFEDLVSPFIMLEQLRKTFMFTPLDESLCYVVKIRQILKRLICFNAMDARGNWEDKPYKYLISKIITIDYDNDYINSLLLYIGNK